MDLPLATRQFFLPRSMINLITRTLGDDCVLVAADVQRVFPNLTAIEPPAVRRHRRLRDMIVVRGTLTPGGLLLAATVPRRHRQAQHIAAGPDPVVLYFPPAARHVLPVPAAPSHWVLTIAKASALHDKKSRRAIWMHLHYGDKTADGAAPLPMSLAAAMQ